MVEQHPVCLPLLRRLPDAADLARRVLDATDWPIAVADDPRDMALVIPTARGGALILLAEVHADDALDRLEAGLAESELMATPTRDGAIQGLAALAGNPMGLPFDIPLALGALEERVSGP